MDEEYLKSGKEFQENVEYESVDEFSDTSDLNFNDSDYSLGEDDDILFEQNVSENIELDARKDIVLSNPPDEYESSDYLPSDELQSVHSDSGDDVVPYTVFNADKEMMNPELEVGKKFSSKQEFMDATRNFSINNRFQIRFPYSDRGRVNAICKADKCPWRVWASKLSEDHSWQIKSFESNHTCSRSFKNKSVSSKWLANRYIETFTIAPKWDMKLFMATVLKEYGVEISKTVAWRARRHAKVLRRGSLVQQFGLLGSYAAEVRRTNPGTTIILSLDDTVFKGIYICFDACKRGFLAGCRPVVCIDGCFLRGEFGGHLLAAVGIDGNDCIFPIAYAVIRWENKESWSWFLKLLGEDLNIENSFGVTFMSDRQKGLENIVGSMFPYAEHRFCVRHMYANLFGANFKSLTVRDYMWRAARSTYVPEFKYWMDKLEKVDEGAWGWLLKKPPAQWSKSHFQTYSKCDLLVNNLCESFNNYIHEARGKDILSLLQCIQTKLMERLYKRREKMAGSGVDICPKALKKLELNKQQSLSWKALYNGDMQYQVAGTNSDDQFVVDQRNRTCSCRRWDLTGLPCPHAIASFRECGMDPLLFVDECYKVSTYIRAYQYAIYPINGSKMWPPSGSEPVKPPGWNRKKRGQPQRLRRKSIEEASLAREKKKKLGKRGSGKCRQCGEKGHNIRYHLKNGPNPPAARNQVESIVPIIGCQDYIDEVGGSYAAPYTFSQPEDAPSITRPEQPVFYSQLGRSTAQDCPNPRTSCKRKSYVPKKRKPVEETSFSNSNIHDTWRKLFEKSTK